MVLKLYVVPEGPPSLSVRQALTMLEIPFELINVDYNQGEHMSAEYSKVWTHPSQPIPPNQHKRLCTYAALIAYFRRQ